MVRKRGYAGFSYADLAKAVGLRKASIHHHFATKADMAIALLASYDARYDLALSAILRNEPDAGTRIMRYAALYLDGVEKGLGCLCAAFAAELDELPQQLRADLKRFFAKHVRWLETVIDEGRARGTIRSDIEPAAFARMIVSLLEGSLMMERALDGARGFGATLGALRKVLDPPSPA